MPPPADSLWASSDRAKGPSYLDGERSDRRNRRRVAWSVRQAGEATGAREAAPLKGSASQRRLGCRLRPDAPQYGVWILDLGQSAASVAATVGSLGRGGPR